MKNQFIINPTEGVVFEADQMYSVDHGVVQVGVEDLKAVIDNAENVIMLEGQAKGKNRTTNAIEDAVLKSCSVAKDYDLFTAEKVLLQIIFGSEQPMLLAEATDITQFADMFPSSTTFIWGIAEENYSDDILTARIMASNLRRK